VNDERVRLDDLPISSAGKKRRLYWQMADVGGEEAVELRLVLHEPLGAGGAGERPRHLAGHAQGPEAGAPRRRDRLGEQRQHALGIEVAVPEVGLALRHDRERARVRGGGDVDPGRVERVEDLLGGRLVGDVEAALAALQAEADEGHEGVELLLGGLVDQAQVVVHLQAPDRVEVRRLVDVCDGQRGAHGLSTSMALIRPPRRPSCRGPSPARRPAP
jgi:hypothetical protein